MLELTLHLYLPRPPLEPARSLGERGARVGKTSAQGLEEPAPGTQVSGRGHDLQLRRQV
jgi:hypothetical protein